MLRTLPNECLRRGLMTQKYLPCRINQIQINAFLFAVEKKKKHHTILVTNKKKRNHIEEENIKKFLISCDCENETRKCSDSEVGWIFDIQVKAT